MELRVTGCLEQAAPVLEEAVGAHADMVEDGPAVKRQRRPGLVVTGFVRGQEQLD